MPTQDSGVRNQENKVVGLPVPVVGLPGPVQVTQKGRPKTGTSSPSDIMAAAKEGWDKAKAPRE